MNTELLKLEDHEEVLRTVRKHWFILLVRTIGVVIVGVAPLILLTLLFSSDYPLAHAIDLQEAYKPALFFSAAWLLIIWMTLFGIWTDYYLDTWIITTRRVIAIDQQGFFRRQVASFRLERLQDVTIDINGIIATFLDFGNIKAETASNAEAFSIRGIPDPRGVKALIQEYADQVVMAPAQSNGAPQTPGTAL